MCASSKPLILTPALPAEIDRERGSLLCGKKTEPELEREERREKVFKFIKGILVFYFCLIFSPTFVSLQIQHFLVAKLLSWLPPN